MVPRFDRVFSLSAGITVFDVEAGYEEECGGFAAGRVCGSDANGAESCGGVGGRVRGGSVGLLEPHVVV